MAALTIFPAIDLKGGQVVRLAEGDMARANVYGDDPAAQARLFADAGASHLHVVDLDGAFAGASVNGAAVEDRKSTRLNSKSLMRLSYAVFCLQNKNNQYAAY